MASRAHGIIVEIIGDERSYLRSAATTISTNTKLEASFRQVGVDANLAADAQIKAALRAQEAQRLNALALSQRAAALPAGSRAQAAAVVLAADAQARYARSVGVTTVATGKLSHETRKSHHELEKALRGAVAGSNVFSTLGRSLIFASTGFVVFEAAAAIVEQSIGAAEDLEKAQRSLEVAIDHTGGSVRKLMPEYVALARAAKQFGQDESEALTGLARATVLTGNAAAAQRAYEEALVISKATGKDFNAVIVATSKGQAGMVTSLRRYGILLESTSTGEQQYIRVMKRFGGQAAANTTESERLRAAVQDFEETIGLELLPTFNRLGDRFTKWIDHMIESGRLQENVNHVVDEAGDIFHTAERAIHAVDSVTGSFANTLKLLVALKFASVIGGWVSGLGRLATAWGGVKVAAQEAAAAETLAGGVGAAAAGSGVAARVGMYTGAGVAAGAAARGGPGAFGNIGKFGRLSGGLIAFADSGRGEPRAKVGDDGFLYYDLLGNGHWQKGGKWLDYPQPDFGPNGPSLGGATQQAFDRIFHPQASSSVTSTSTGMFGGLKPQHQFTMKFELKPQEQILQAQAALTRTTTDDVAGARKVVARIEGLIENRRIHGRALIEALGLEASALSTIWQAEDAAAQKRAAAAQAEKDRIAAQIQNSIDPLRLEVQLSKAQAQGKPLEAILRRLRSAAEKALASGKLSLEQQKEAWDQITSLNQQLGSSAETAFGTFKQLNTRALTADLGLSDRQRQLLRARLSQLGPGRTMHGTGTGAFGYEIGHDRRPTVIHNHVHLDSEKVGTSVTNVQQKRAGRNSSQRRGPHA